MNKEILEKRIERLEGQLKAKDEVIDKLVAYNKNSGYLSSNLADLEDRIQKAMEYIKEQKEKNNIMIDEDDWYIRDKVEFILKGESDE